MQTNIWLKQRIALYIGGDPTKGQAPMISTDINHPQILIDPEKGTVTIIETVQPVVRT